VVIYGDREFQIPSHALAASNTGKRGYKLGTTIRVKNEEQGKNSGDKGHTEKEP